MEFPGIIDYQNRKPEIVSSDEPATENAERPQSAVRLSLNPKKGQVDLATPAFDYYNLCERPVEEESRSRGRGRPSCACLRGTAITFSTFFVPVLHVVIPAPRLGSFRLSTASSEPGILPLLRYEVVLDRPRTNL